MKNTHHKNKLFFYFVILFTLENTFISHSWSAQTIKSKKISQNQDPIIRKGSGSLLRDPLSRPAKGFLTEPTENPAFNSNIPQAHGTMIDIPSNIVVSPKIDIPGAFLQFPSEENEDAGPKDKMSEESSEKPDTMHSNAQTDLISTQSSGSQTVDEEEEEE